MEDKKKEKEAKMKEQKELAALFKPVQTQKVEKGMLYTGIIILHLARHGEDRCSKAVTETGTQHCCHCTLVEFG